MAKKSKMKVVAVYDGELEAADVFAELITRKINENKKQEYLAETDKVLYNEDKVHEISNRPDCAGNAL